jgi:hypothetical protein
MEQPDDALNTLSEIRTMMERSTRFLSLSGLSGVFAGIFALIGATAAYYYLGLSLTSPGYYQYAQHADGSSNQSFLLFFFTDALLVLFASLAIAILLSQRRAKARGVKIWDPSARRLLVNMFLPLFVGGVFCLVLVYHGFIGLVAPTTLVFYGLALIHASHYTLPEIRYLGITECVIGLLATLWLGYGLLFWALGFGIMHILYGTIMYYKYER